MIPVEVLLDRLEANSPATSPSPKGDG
jgi:hypothetical protein